MAFYIQNKVGKTTQHQLLLFNYKCNTSPQHATYTSTKIQHFVQYTNRKIALSKNLMLFTLNLTLRAWSLPLIPPKGGKIASPLLIAPVSLLTTHNPLSQKMYVIM